MIRSDRLPELRRIANPLNTSILNVLCNSFALMTFAHFIDWDRVLRASLPPVHDLGYVEPMTKIRENRTVDCSVSGERACSIAK
jgi:hypothetical protein